MMEQAEKLYLCTLGHIGIRHIRRGTFESEIIGFKGKGPSTQCLSTGTW